MKNIIYLILSSVLLISFFAEAEEMNFHKLWNKIESRSPLILQKQHQWKASKLASERAALHWLPSLSLQSSLFSTNDPGTSFFSTLSQRKINSLDFSPNSLNQPGSHTFQTVSLGVDLPIYEGGRKISEKRALYNWRDSNESMLKASRLSEYRDVALDYIRLSSLQVARERLEGLSDQVSQILSRYSIGSQSNPVGYSGILGLKSLKNRISAELLSIEAQKKSHAFSLSEKAGLEMGSWSAHLENVAEFLDQELLISEKQDSVSHLQSALIAQAQAMDEMKSAEKSRYLPKLGLFANEGIMHGDRDTGTSFTGGLYLQWSLFNPDHLNRVAEKEELRQSAVSDLNLASQSQSIARKTLKQNEQSIQQTLSLLKESEQLSTEQVKVMGKLFQSGSVSALQLAEVLNRRVDLVLNLLSAEQNLIETRGKQVELTSRDEVMQ